MDRLGIIFGGKSGEHEVSLLSAKSVIDAFEGSNHQLVLIGITKQGQWKLYNGKTNRIADGSWEQYAEPFAIHELSDLIDFAFPVLHGTYGEDGTIQGMFEMMDIPYAGCGVLASASCMDKVTAKMIFEREGIPSCKYTLVCREEIEEDIEKAIDTVEDKIPYPMFVKPSNMGSSVGISKARNREQLRKGLLEAAEFDRRLIIEEGLNCREIETGVVGNYYAEAAAVGEIIQKQDFYDYEAKYTDDAGTELSIPAELPEETYEKIRELAVKAYKVMDCSGFSRVDFFIERETGKIYLNEINTIPGFTKYSMFPSLWKAAGTDFSELVERIVTLGYERYNAKNHRKTDISR